MTYFFTYPFAVSGDQAAVDTSNPGTGDMSYQQGYPVNYQLNLLTDPAARPINRQQFNRLMFDVTDNLNQYQTHAIAQWVPAAANLGVALPYDIYAKVRYNVSNPGVEGAGTLVYTNLVQGNITTPGADNSWWSNGQTLSVNVPDASAVPLPVTNVPTDVTSLTLPPGAKWAVYGNIMFDFTDQSPGYRVWCNTVSATEPDISLTSSGAAQTSLDGSRLGCPAPVLIVDTTAGAVTVYLSGWGQFTVGSVTGSGSIIAIPIGSAA